jgi:membrane-associated protease RseP (regulator of RpoE activity)
LTLRWGRQSNPGTVTVRDVAEAAVTAAVVPSTVTVLFAGVGSNPVPAIVALSPSTMVSGPTDATESRVDVASKATGEPVIAAAAVAVAV